MTTKPLVSRTTSGPSQSVRGEAPMNTNSQLVDTSSVAPLAWSTRVRASRCAAPRAPFALETSVPGVFAAGDVRLDSMKRVASAVGEGAMSVYLVHRYLATM